MDQPKAQPESDARPTADGGAPFGSDRIAEALRGEADRRMHLTVAARTAALLALAPIVALVNGLPAFWYFAGVIALFILLGWVQLAATRMRPDLSWPLFALVALDFALLTAALLLPNPMLSVPPPPQTMLRFGNFIYFFLLLAGLAFSFRPGLVLWGGVVGAVFWSVGRAWILAAAPDIVISVNEPQPRTPEEMAAWLDLVFDPNFVDLGIWVQEVAVFLIVAGMLALIVRGSRRLVWRQALLERRSANLSRYFPARLAERMADRDAPFAEDQERRAAVLFTDIVGFTGWAEERPSPQVMSFLRGAHAAVAGAVFETGGVLDKFIGDGVMATFGAADAPDPDMPDEAARARRDARAALACAELIIERFDAFASEWAREHGDRLRISLGVHFGPVAVGDVGSDRRMELAVMGDTVNVASRLEALTRGLGCAAAASQETMDAAGGPPPGWRFAGERPIAGRRGTERIWVLDAPS